jgi:cytoskeletal protein RodZ
VSSFGEMLKDAREARGLSLDRVVEATRVARHHLVALENGDLEALPAGPFAKGYIEAYGKAVGIDPRPVIEAYRAEARHRAGGTGGAQDRTIEELAQIVHRRTGATSGTARTAAFRNPLVLGSCAAAALVIGGWLLLRGGARDEGGVGPPPTSAPDAESPPRSEASPLPGAAPAPDRGAKAPSREEPTPAPRPNPDIAISDSGVGTGVENHLLVGPGAEFPEGSEVVFWTRVVGGRSGDVIDHVWLHEGRGIARIPLTIGGSPWRTFSRRPLPQGAAGGWTVEARGLDGRLLARQDFVCVSARR